MIAGLPYDAEVEYLGFVDGAYIDTGIVPSNLFDISMTASFDSDSPSQSTLFSASRGSFIVRKNSQNIQFNGAGFWGVIYALADTNAHVYHIKSTNGTQWYYSIDGEQEILGKPNLGSLSNLSNLLIGWRYTYTAQYGGLRCYHFAYGNVLDLTPVRFTNELGQSEGAMYDRVSKKLFRNAGTGSFVVGPDVAVPVMGLHFMRRPRCTAKDYVQNGLVAMWDGIENAGWGVHDPNATTWKNLVGTSSGADIAVTAGYFLDNALAVTGNNYNQTAGAIPSATELTTEVSFTIPSVGRASGNIFAWRVRIGGPYLISTAWGYLRVTGGGNGNYRNDDNSYDLTPYIGNEFRASMANFVGQKGLYVNGAIARPSFVAQVGTDDRYKTHLYTGGQSEIRFHSVRVYNRLLSGAEISANSAIDKTRFNLP